MTHHRLVCVRCSTTIEECRCPARDKLTLYGLCPTCKEAGELTQQEKERLLDKGIEAMSPETAARMAAAAQHIQRACAEAAGFMGFSDPAAFAFGMVVGWMLQTTEPDELRSIFDAYLATDAHRREVSADLAVQVAVRGHEPT